MLYNQATSYHNFLIRVTDSPGRWEAFLGLVLTDANEITDQVKNGDNLGCSYLIEFIEEYGPGKEKSKEPELQESEIPAVEKFAGEIPWGIVFRDKGSIRAGSSLRTHFIQHKNSKFLHVKNQEGKAGKQQGPAYQAEL